MSANSSTSTSEARAGRLLLVLMAVLAVLLGGAELLHRSVPRDLPPGWLNHEFQARLDQVDPRRDIVFVGDSRIGWGVADRLVTEYLRAAGFTGRAWNLGNPAGGTRLLKGMADTLVQQGGPAGTLVIGVSPAFLYSFANDPLAGRTRHVNPLERRFDAVFTGLLTARLAQVPDNVRYHLAGRPLRITWGRRDVHPEGFVNATLMRSDGAPIDTIAYQLDFYRGMLQAIRSDEAAVAARQDEFAAFVQRFIDGGWTVVLIRMPLLPDLLALENTLPADMQMPAIQARLGVPAIDYTADSRSRDLESIDGSHLSPTGARAFAAIVAADLQGIAKAR